jgi:hypothetical protein
MDGYLGVDVGSVTTKCAVITEGGELIAYNYHVPRVSRSLPEGRDSGKFRGIFPLMSGSVVDASKYSLLESGLYFG